MSGPTETFNQVERYERYMETVRARATSREFDGDYVVPREHYEMIIEAARHAPSGADAQPWHYIGVTDPGLKDQLAGHFVRERHRRIELGMKFPSPNYRGMATAPGLIVVVADFRYVKAFPVLGDGSELDRMYQQNAERILLQSVAASTMAAHLAAAALGYAVWWVTAIGQEEAQQAIRPLLDVPGRTVADRHHVLRPSAQAAVQAVEEADRRDHELGPLRPRQVPHQHPDR